MSTLRHPVGPQPPEVYWRRRLVVGLGLLAVIVIVVLIIVRPGAGDPGEQETPNPQTTETSEPGEGAVDGAPVACAPSQVTVTPVTDANSYSAGQQPLLSLTLLNTGAAPCTISAGTDVQVYVITSGSDLIWTSTDCQESAVAAEVVLEPGVELSTTPFAWGRVRSAPDNCGPDRPLVTAGGATYRLSVSVGDLESAEDRPFILN